MNLLETIHDLWAANANLTILLPATDDETTNKVHSGLNFTPELPYASLEKQGGRPVQYDGCSAVDFVSLQIQVFIADHSHGEKIIRAIKAAFDRTNFDLVGGTSSSSGDDADHVTNMQRTNDDQVQGQDGTWQFVVNFDVWVHLADGY